MKIAAILLALLMFFGCTAQPVQSDEVFEPEKEAAVQEEPEQPVEQEREEEPEPTEINFAPVKLPSPKAAVRSYFSALYDSYIAMLPVDLSPAIDLEYEIMQNVQNWNDLLILRRRLIAENDYCYVETERFDYEIVYIEESELDDQRMYYVDLDDFGENAAVLHFVIKGEEGKAYPPIFALNSQHTVVLTEENGQYKIAYHYFPGSEGKFENDLPVAVLTEEEMSALLAEEFAGGEEITAAEAKYRRIYNGEAAAKYALEYCESPNEDFYFVGDWYGNCMNFASQCIWAGFKDEDESPKNYECMTYRWYCGKSGGTLIWTSVSRFWNWTLEQSCGMQTLAFYSVYEAKAGDIVHIGSYACETEDKYAHALLLVNEEKLILAQNSPANFIYYSDLANNYAKFIRPVSLNA